MKDQWQCQLLAWSIAICNHLSCLSLQLADPFGQLICLSQCHHILDHSLLVGREVRRQA